MLKDKKKLIIYISVAVLTIIIIAVATVIILQSSNNATTQSVPTKATIAVLKLDAVKILNSNPVKARTILLKAKQQYQDLNDTNGVTDVESLIWQIDHPVTK